MRRSEARATQTAAAANLAAWHASSTRALGLRSWTDERWWTCAMPAPNVYYSAVSLAPAPGRRARRAMVDELGAHIEHRDTSVVSVCDTWDELDLRPCGLTRRMSGRWLLRAPGDAVLPSAASSRSGNATRGLRIEPVVDRKALARFERTMVVGFGARPPIAAFDIHAPGILDDPAMRVLGGWVDDEMVACSMACVTEVVGIYGVATRPEWRRNGYASAMATAAAAVAPERTVVLQPTPEAGDLYLRLGFRDLGPFSHWA